MKCYSLIPFMKNILSRRRLVSFMSFIENWLYAKASTHIALEPPSASGLYLPTKLASTSYAVSLCCLYTCISEEDDAEQLGGFFVVVDY